jgi:hypothetical protein
MVIRVMLDIGALFLGSAVAVILRQLKVDTGVDLRDGVSEPQPPGPIGSRCKSRDPS